jgi:hypothetical protein
MSAPVGFRFLNVGELILSTDLHLPYGDGTVEDIDDYTPMLNLYGVGDVWSNNYVPMIRQAFTPKGNKIINKVLDIQKGV